MATTIEPRQEELDRLYFEIFKEVEPSRKDTKAEQATIDNEVEWLTDEVVIAGMLGSAKANEIQALLNGDTSAYNGDDSAADLALCNYLALSTRKNRLQMDRIFRQSKLMRPKWDEKRGSKTYGERTIDEACRTTSYSHELPKDEGSGPKEVKEKEISEEELKKIKIPEHPRFKTFLEPDNFIQVFIGYGETVTDSYPDYWFAGGLFCLSVAVNRNAVIKLRQGPVYSNVWLNLLGLSSISRKTTSIDKTDITIIAANIDPNCKMPDEFSPEAMIERLDQHPRAYMLKDESAGMLAVMKKDYMRGLKDALMQLFDGKDINRELRTSRKADKTKFHVKNPYLCLMLATTPGSFSANTELIDITSGWLPRFLHSYPNHAKDRWLPLEEGVPENDLLSAGCQARLIIVRNEFYDLPEARIMHLSPEAKDYFTEWQRIREKELVEAKDDRRAQFYSRLAVYALKMGMLFTVGRADYKDGMEISTDHMKEACRLIDEYFMPMALTVADLVGKSADKNQLDKIIAVLTSRGGKLTKREIARVIHPNKMRDLDDWLATLQESGEIRLVTVSNKRGPPTVYVILSSDIGNDQYCHTVNTVKPVILSLSKTSNEDGGELRNDSMTVMTVCDKMPIDTGSGGVELSGLDTVTTKPETGEPHLEGKEPLPAQNPETFDPATKARLWDDIRLKLRKYGRVDGTRRGLAVSDLNQSELSLIEADGWTLEVIEISGIPVYWATEKTLKAMGWDVEA